MAYLVGVSHASDISHDDSVDSDASTGAATNHQPSLEVLLVRLARTLSATEISRSKACPYQDILQAMWTRVQGATDLPDSLLVGKSVIAINMWVDSFRDALLNAISQLMARDSLLLTVKLLARVCRWQQERYRSTAVGPRVLLYDGALTNFLDGCLRLATLEMSVGAMNLDTADAILSLTMFSRDLHLRLQALARERASELLLTSTPVNTHQYRDLLDKLWSVYGHLNDDELGARPVAIASLWVLILTVGKDHDELCQFAARMLAAAHGPAWDDALRAWICAAFSGLMAKDTSLLLHFLRRPTEAHTLPVARLLALQARRLHHVPKNVGADPVETHLACLRFVFRFHATTSQHWPVPVFIYGESNVTYDLAKCVAALYALRPRDVASRADEWWRKVYDITDVRWWLALLMPGSTNLYFTPLPRELRPEKHLRNMFDNGAEYVWG